MGKITDALKKSDEERLDQRQRSRVSAEEYSKGGKKMKNSWWVWLFIIGVVVTIFVSFNSQKGKDVAPLTEIFPDEKVVPVDVEYEFVESDIPAVDIQVTQKGEHEMDIKKEVVKDIPVKKKKISKTIENKFTAKNSFTIQVASFKTEDRAKKKMDALNKKGYSLVYIVSKDLGSKGIWYRVYVGRFDTKAQAEELLKKVKREYKNSFIIKK